LVVLEDRDRSLELHLELNERLDNGHSFGSDVDWDPDFDNSQRNSGQKHDSKRINGYSFQAYANLATIPCL